MSGLYRALCLICRWAESRETILSFILEKEETMNIILSAAVGLAIFAAVNFDARMHKCLLKSLDYRKQTHSTYTNQGRE